MDRRRFLISLVSAPIAAVLAPLAAKNPSAFDRWLWMKPDQAALRAEYAYQVNARLDAMRVDIHQALMDSLTRDVSLIRFESPLADGQPIRFEWQEDS